jgi:hypothetical protein
MAQEVRITVGIYESLNTRRFAAVSRRYDKPRLAHVLTHVAVLF